MSCERCDGTGISKCHVYCDCPDGKAMEKSDSDYVTRQHSIMDIADGLSPECVAACVDLAKEELAYLNACEEFSSSSMYENSKEAKQMNAAGAKLRKARIAAIALLPKEGTVCEV